MAEINAFAGIKFREGLGDYSDLAAPPYDVISDEHRDRLYERHGYNIVRVDYGRPEKGDTAGDNRYTRAARCLDGWLREGALVREKAPAIYLYRVEYKTPQGEAKTMGGFVCMLRLEEWDKGVVLPHEGTLKGPKQDRLELLKATGMSASQIFSFYTDPRKTITKALNAAAEGRDADMEATDGDGAVHQVWAVSDPKTVEAVRAAMQKKKVFIADGHHRYETALAYRDYRRGQGGSTGEEPFNFVPMFLANMDDGGLTILPTHRLIKSCGVKVEDVLKRAKRYFHIEKLPFTSDYEPAQRKLLFELLAEKGRSSHVFGLYYGGNPYYYLLTLKDLDPVTDALWCSCSEAYCGLDVTILHELVIDRVLGIDTDAISEYEPVQFEKDGDRAVERVAAGEFDLCFLLNATKVKEVREIALAGEIMPQKSTYFYPKLLTGLVIAELGPREG